MLPGKQGRQELEQSMGVVLDGVLSQPNIKGREVWRISCLPGKKSLFCTPGSGFASERSILGGDAPICQESCSRKGTSCGLVFSQHSWLWEMAHRFGKRDQGTFTTSVTLFLLCRNSGFQGKMVCLKIICIILSKVDATD